MKRCCYFRHCSCVFFVFIYLLIDVRYIVCIVWWCDYYVWWWCQKVLLSYLNTETGFEMLFKDKYHGLWQDLMFQVCGHYRQCLGNRKQAHSSWRTLLFTEWTVALLANKQTCPCCCCCDRIKRDILPVVLALCQDVDYEVRACMSRLLDPVARGLG